MGTGLGIDLLDCVSTTTDYYLERGNLLKILFFFYRIRVLTPHLDAGTVNEYSSRDTMGPL